MRKKKLLKLLIAFPPVDTEPLSMTSKEGGKEGRKRGRMDEGQVDEKQKKEN